MALTRTDLANKALSKLMEEGGSGQSPAAEDTAKADSAIDGMFELLSETNVYTVADDQDIPLAAFDSLALYLAGLIGTDFGKSEMEGQQRCDLAEKKLIRLTAGRPTLEPLAVDYF